VRHAADAHEAAQRHDSKDEMFPASSHVRNPPDHAEAPRFSDAREEREARYLVLLSTAQERSLNFCNQYRWNNPQDRPVVTDSERMRGLEKSGDGTAIVEVAWSETGVSGAMMPTT
jgi:hypothetical protein